MDTKDKLIEKLKEYIEYLICRPRLIFKMGKFESEIAALDRQILDEGWKELENSGLDKPFIPSQVEEKESKETKYGKRLAAGRNFLMTQDPKYLIVEDCLEAFGFTRDGLNEIV